MFIIVSGNPIDGLSFEGPYSSSEEAIGAAEGRGGDWWIAPLNPADTEYLAYMKDAS